jgi:hypothetical protein
VGHAHGDLGLGLDFASQGDQGRAGRRFGEALQGGVGDLAPDGQGQQGRARTMLVGHGGQGREGFADGAGDVVQGVGGVLLGAGHGRVLALRIGLGLGGLDFLDGEAALGPSRRLAHAAAIVEDGVEGETLVGDVVHAAISPSRSARRRCPNRPA